MSFFDWLLHDADPPTCKIVAASPGCQNLSLLPVQDICTSRPSRQFCSCLRSMILETDLAAQSIKLTNKTRIILLVWHLLTISQDQARTLDLKRHLNIPSVFILPMKRWTQVLESRCITCNFYLNLFIVLILLNLRQINIYVEATPPSRSNQLPFNV